ncbi:Short-chain dehydrogenase/reductase ATR7 [Apiospora rasikravindrae]|uniref:Short-chain dehydrogenase/reductase ATR7 n=1 Tax=Apiospora rasikravindrae TaxID=990691 RepID=A0ABR1SCQ2_9PEZI
MADPKFDDGDLTSLRGKVIIVTGGSSGIGLATVELLLSLGAAVVSGDQHPPPAPQVIYPSAGSDVAAFFTYVPTDVGVWADLVRLFQRAIQVHGRVDHVFANAGTGGVPSRARGEGDYEPCHTVLDVGLKGAINTTTLAMHHMRAQDPRGGSIVINGSITSLQDVGGVDHAVSKHGILGFGLGLKSSSLGTASLSIRVNVLMPGRTEHQVVEDIAAAAAREVAQLMADSTRDGHVVFAGEGQYSAIEEAKLLPAHR